MRTREEIQRTRKSIDKKLAEYSNLKSQYKKEEEELEKTETTLSNLNEAQSIAQAVAQAVQQQAHNQIAGVVTKCLETVFDEPYRFKICFEQKRGRTEARLAFERDGLEVDPLTASGGGMVDVAAFALRLSCILLSKPQLRKVIILDEPFKFVSRGYQKNVRKMLESLSKDLGIQIIFVTHIPELETGKVIELE